MTRSDGSTLQDTKKLVVIVVSNSQVSFTGATFVAPVLVLISL